MLGRTSSLNGTLWKWNSKGHVAFISGNITSTYHLICLGGLTDGLYPCPWIQQLHERCCYQSWALVQPILSNSYSGYGTGTLDRDVEELSQFIQHLSEEWNCKRIMIIGHSTGCQIAIHLTNYGPEEILSYLYGIVLQAPVSDQEAGTLSPETERYLVWAREQPPEISHTLMPIDAHYTPITIERYLSLFDYNGQDDYFSSYHKDHEFQQKFRGIRTRSLTLKRILVAYSMNDEYVPPSIDKEVLVNRLVQNLGPRAMGLKLYEANHNLSLPEDGSSVTQFLEAVEGIMVEIAEQIAEEE